MCDRLKECIIVQPLVPQPTFELLDDWAGMWHWKGYQWLNGIDFPGTAIDDCSPYHVGEIITSNGKSFMVNEVQANLTFVDGYRWEWLCLVEKVG